VALFAACCSANAADLFFVVGQADARWHGLQAPAAPPAETKLLSWTVGAEFTSLAAQACQKDCPEAMPVDGVVPAFAHTWTGLSKSPAHFVIYRKPDAALTKAGAGNNSYWTDFEAPKGVYQGALKEFRQARKSSAIAAGEGIGRRYLIWVQNEIDALVTAKDYQAKLTALFDRFNKDLATDGKPFDAMFIVSSGLLREAGSKADKAYRDRLNAIVQAQDGAAALGKVVMVSRAMRTGQMGCVATVGGSDCASKDLLRYHAWLYESLGTEMARNAFIYHSKGIKPLLPANCKREPASCAGTADVYSWMAKGDAPGEPVYGTDPYEFDEAAYRIGRMRFALFVEAAAGRIPLYRDAKAGGPGLSTVADSTVAKVLGYCYAAPTGNATARLMVIEQDGMTGLTRQPAEASEANALRQAGDKTLCYVN
jgi:hypothetical protein